MGYAHQRIKGMINFAVKKEIRWQAGQTLCSSSPSNVAAQER